MKTNTVLILATLLALTAMVGAQSTINSSDKYAYGANTGWMDFRSTPTYGVVVGEAYLSGRIYAANFGWISAGDGSPVNGHTYSNAAANDTGVNHDGAGNLSGYGYSGNIGWINFGWASANDPNRPHFDLLTGQFSGYAYSANTGWINLNVNLTTDTLSCPDKDTDGMADAWEYQKFGDLETAEIGTDRDGDGQSDAAEYAADTDPHNTGEYLRIISQSYNVDVTRVTLQFSTTRPTRKYLIQTSTTLLGGHEEGDWIMIGREFLGESGTTSASVRFDNGHRRFFRVVAQKPLQ